MIEAFVGEKEERLVLAVIDFRDVDGSPHGSAPAVIVQNRLGGSGCVREKVFGEQHRVSVELIDVTVERIGPAFDDRIDIWKY